MLFELLYPKHEFIPARILYSLQRPGSAAIGCRRLAEGSANANNWNWVTFCHISSLKFWGIPKNRGGYDIWKGDFLYKFDVFNDHLVVVFFPQTPTKIHHQIGCLISSKLKKPSCRDPGSPTHPASKPRLIYIDVENGLSLEEHPINHLKSMEFLAKTIFHCFWNSGECLIPENSFEV